MDACVNRSTWVHTDKPPIWMQTPTLTDTPPRSGLWIGVSSTPFPRHYPWLPWPPPLPMVALATAMTHGCPGGMPWRGHIGREIMFTRRPLCRPHHGGHACVCVCEQGVGRGALITCVTLLLGDTKRLALAVGIIIRKRAF